MAIETDDRLVPWCVLEREVQLPASKPTLLKMEAMGKFPRSVRLGRVKRWHLGTVKEWRARLFREASSDAA